MLIKCVSIDMASLIEGIVQLELCGHTRIAVVGVNV